MEEKGQKYTVNGFQASTIHQAGGRECPHMPFPALLSDTVGQNVFLMVIFSFLFYSKKRQPTPSRATAPKM